MSPLKSPHHEVGPSMSNSSFPLGTNKSNNSRKSAGTVCILGLSGPEQEKGALGVGKSTLCNRIVRPNFVNFTTEHLNCLSQADFLCSPVINANHWLYWGEVELEKEWKMEGRNVPAPPNVNKRITHLRVVEQTVFLDDEGFAPLGTSFRRGKVAEDYSRKALAIQLESAGKIAYQSRDQLGQEGDFAWEELPDGGQINVDAFCFLFDVSSVPGRFQQRQPEFIALLLLGAAKTKKPIFLVATKFDECSLEGKAEWQKLLARKELKTMVQHQIQAVVELSALENVNVAELVWSIVDSMEKGRNKYASTHRCILPYSDALQQRLCQIEQIKLDFHTLLHSVLPREEYLLRRGEISWARMLADGTISMQSGYNRFIREFGPKAAKCAFNEHLRACKEWWFDHELSVRLGSLRDVLRRMFSRSFLCQIRWPHLVKEIELHPEFDAFFQPLGRSLDRFSTINGQQWDERLPSELLQKAESEGIFGELQRELLNEISLERQADKFRQLLAQKEAITPSRSFSDAKVMVEEVVAFEQALPSGTALRIYEQYQEEIIQRAQREFLELLQEQIELFVDIVVIWRTKHPELPPLIGLDAKQNAAVHSILREDKRYRTLNGLPDLRSTLIGQFASFLSLPLERHCPGGVFCADLGASILLQRHIQNSSRNFFAIELALHGPPKLTSQLFDAIRSHTTGSCPSSNSLPVFLHNGLSVQFGPANNKLANCNHPNCSSHSSICSSASSSASSFPPCSIASRPSLSARIPSQLFLFSTLEEAEQHSVNAIHPNNYSQHQLISRPSIGGICPLVILIAKIDDEDVHNAQILQQIGNKLADHLGGMFKVLPTVNGPDCVFGNENGPDGDKVLISRFHLDMLLHEICSLQLDSGHSDLRVRCSSMCGDSTSIECILAPLLDHSHLPIDHSGRKFYFDTHLSNGNNEEIMDEENGAEMANCSPRKEMPSPTPSQQQKLFTNANANHRQNGCKARVCITIGSFHQWLLAKWPLQSVQGHMLVFSPHRRASWRHARCATKLLLDSVGHSVNNGEMEEEDQERRAMGRSIFLVALLAEFNDKTSQNDKRSARILAKAERFATQIGAMFAPIRSNGQQHIHQCFLEFFQRILQNPFPPAEYYTITSRGIVGGGNNFDDWRSIAQSQFGICSTLTGSAETLMTERSDDEEEEEADDCWVINNEMEMATKNTQWRRKSKQSRIALVGSPPPPPHQQQQPKLNAQQMPGRKRIPPVLRNDSQLSRLTGISQWTNGSALTASTLTAAMKGENMSRHGSDSTTRTPLASSANGNDKNGIGINGNGWNGRTSGERPHSAVILPSSTISPPFSGVEDVEQQEIVDVGNRNATTKTPRRLEKLISSFVQFRATTPIIPLADEKTSNIESMPTAAGSRRSRMQRMAATEMAGKTIKISHSSTFVSSQLKNNKSINSHWHPAIELMTRSMDSLFIMEKIGKNDEENAKKLSEIAENIEEKWEWKRSRRSRSEMPNKWKVEENAVDKVEDGLSPQQSSSPFFVRHILPWPRRKRQMPNSKSGEWENSNNGTVESGKFHTILFLNDDDDDDLVETGSKANPSGNFPSPQPKLPSNGNRFAQWLRSPRSQSRSRGQNAKFAHTNLSTSQSSALSPSTTLSSDASIKSAESQKGKQQQQKTLAECCAQSRDGLPPFLVKCVRTIEHNGGLETEGLYRVPGNQNDVERMFQKGNSTLNFNKIPVHAVATGLKRFLDGLTESLIPEKMHSAILNVFEAENSIAVAIDGKKATQIVSTIRSNLPLENWRVLCFLIGHLQRVAECSATNSMDLRNLAKVWSPTLFRPNFESFESMATSMAKFEMATFLLLFTNCDKK